jgi:hypothetical protein
MDKSLAFKITTSPPVFLMASTSPLGEKLAYDGWLSGWAEATRRFRLVSHKTTLRPSAHTVLPSGATATWYDLPMRCGRSNASNT